MLAQADNDEKANRRIVRLYFPTFIDGIKRLLWTLQFISIYLTPLYVISHQCSAVVDSILKDRKNSQAEACKITAVKSLEA